jgi:hypothetical protein
MPLSGDLPVGFKGLHPCLQSVVKKSPKLTGFLLCMLAAYLA